MSREILTTVKVERFPVRSEYGVKMTTTTVDTGSRKDHPISPTIKEEPSIFTMQTDLSRRRRRLALMQAGSLGVVGAASSFAAGEAVTIFNRGEIDFTRGAFTVAAQVGVAVGLARFTAMLNGRRSTVNVQSEAAEMARQDPSRTVEIERRRKKRRLIGFKNIKTRIPQSPVRELA